MSSAAPILLVFGASGRTGVEVIRAAAKHAAKPAVHAFVRAPERLAASERALCASVQVGDARNVEDVAAALRATKADIAIVAIGSASLNHGASNNIREECAQALVDALNPNKRRNLIRRRRNNNGGGNDYDEDGGGEEEEEEEEEDGFGRVRVIVVSSVGAADSTIRIGFGVGAVVTYMLRHALDDHTRQEKCLRDALSEQVVEGNAAGAGAGASAGARADGRVPPRLLIVRPMGLSDGSATGNVCAVENDQQLPSFSVARADVAQWIVEQACEGSSFGRCFNVTAGR